MHAKAARPRIGITNGSANVAEYERAVTAAGGEAIELRHGTPGVLELAAGIDGLVFSGGADIDPARYGQEAHKETEIASAGRDAFELDLIRTAYERELPTLAICRGVQVANVAFGGTLFQHVPDVFGPRIRHHYAVRGRAFRSVIEEHVVAVAAGSRLEGLVGAALATGSRHHQSLDRIAERFRIVARTPDGVVEAIEPVDTAWFWLGVQWHPESTVDEDGGKSRALFRALVTAAGG